MSVVNIAHSWEPTFVAGLDLGQAADYSALAIVEHVPVGGPFARPRQDDQQLFHVRHLHRYQLGTRYPEVVDDVSSLLVRDPLRGKVELAIDATGVGRGVVDLFTAPKITAPLLPITITAGDVVTSEWEAGCKRYRVPKRDLIIAVQVLLQTGRLKIASDLPFAETLTRELLNYRVKINLAGHDSYGAGPAGLDAWREGEHDDMLLALALACWAFLHAERSAFYSFR
jgi:hypothetical protein